MNYKIIKSDKNKEGGAILCDGRSFLNSVVLENIFYETTWEHINIISHKNVTAKMRFQWNLYRYIWSNSISIDSKGVLIMFEWTFHWNIIGKIPMSYEL